MYQVYRVEHAVASSLEQRVAEAGFPAGVRIPLVIVVAGLVLLAGFCAVALNGQQPRSTADAVAQSHQWFAGNLARALGESVNESVGELATTVRLYTAKPGLTADDTLEFFAKNSLHTKGLAVLDRTNGRLLASAGEPVPVESLRAGDLAGVSARTVLDRYGQARTVIAGVLPGNQLIVTCAELTVPQSTVDSLAATVLLGTATGQVIRPGGGPPETGDLARQAAAAAAGGNSGHLVGAEQPGQHMVALAAYAPVTMGDAQARLGVSLILLGTTPVAADTSSGAGLLPAATLLGVTALVVLLLGGGLIRPIRRLRADALAIAGGRLDQPVRAYRLREARPIAAALDQCRGRLPRRNRTSGLSARTTVILASAAILAWSGSVMLTAGRAEVHVPDQAVRITQDLAQNTADALRRSLAQSVSDLQSFAGLVSDPNPAALGPALSELAARHTRYRSVYVIGPGGKVVALAGRSPLRDEQRVPDLPGLHQENTDGRVPVIYASAPLPDHQHVLIGELDVLKLSALVRKPGGSGRLVDAGLRTLAATDGYRAFEELDAEPLRGSVQAALHDVPAPTVQDVNGRPSVIAAAAIYGSTVTNELRWAVVIEQPVSQLPLLGNDIRHSAALAALLGFVLALLSLGWHLLVLVLPLRRVAAAAARLAGGDTTAVIYPQRSDEIGTIAGCLELCRQRAVSATPTKGAPCGSSTRPI